jgi:hypothetical protein
MTGVHQDITSVYIEELLMLGNRFTNFSRLIVALVFPFLLNYAIADPIDNALFVQNNLRACSGEMSCVGGDPSIEFDSDTDFGETGSATTQVFGPTPGTQSAVSAGYTGDAFTPAISAYAYTDGPVRYTISALGVQRYEFVADGEIMIGGNLTYGQTGQSSPSSENPRGITNALFMAFQMNDDIFDPTRCNIYNIFSGPGAPNESGFITSCLRFNGTDIFEVLVEFEGLQNYQESVFETVNGPVLGGSLSTSLTVSGITGDVFYLAASLGGQAHLGGFMDSANTLLLDFDSPELVEPSFSEDTFVLAPTRMVSIDIKPGSEPNCININGHGVIPVAILGDASLDVSTIDQASLKFGGVAVGIRGRKGPQCGFEYVNADEYLDLVCHFDDDPSNWSPDDNATASVFGSLFDGRQIEGFDTICLNSP